MPGLFPYALFNGFGPDRLRPDGDSPPFQLVVGERRNELRQRLRQQCPRLPGVYGMLDRRGVLIYVGKAKRLRLRLLSYFRSGSRAEKAGRIIARARAIVWESAPSEFAALIRELELIRRWRPGYNVQGMPGFERYIYHCIGRKPAPYAYATREPTGKEQAVFGPFKGGAMTREAARRLNDLFQLRDCSQQQTMHFSEQRAMFPLTLTPGCLRYDLGTCLGPCAAYTSQSSYGRHVRAARAFLEGHNVEALQKLESEMTAAAGAAEFERAARIRDKLAPLKWIRERLDWLDQARMKYSFVYPVASAAGPPLWYLIRQGRVCKAVVAPGDDASRRRAAEAISSVFAPRNVAAFAPVNQVDHVLLVASWFRRSAKEKEMLMSPEQALANCCAAAA